MEKYTITRTPLEGVAVIEPESIIDDRGIITPLLDCEGLASVMAADGYPLFTDGKPVLWPPYFEKANLTVSGRNVLRGIHVSPELWKVFTCLRGGIWLAVVDCRPGPTFGKSILRPFSECVAELITVPPMFGVAHWIEEDRDSAEVLYFWSGAYDGGEQISYRWDSFGIKWPFSGKPILSERDKNAEKAVTANQQEPR